MSSVVGGRLGPRRHVVEASALRVADIDV